MTTNRKYWMCQVAGWGAYGVTGIAASLPYTGMAPSLVSGWLFFIGYSIALTDLLRREMRRRRWLEASAGRVFLRLALAVIAAAVIQTFLVASINVAFVGGRSFFLIRSTVLYTLWGIFCADGLWVGLYLGLTSKRRHAEKETRLQLGLREAELRALESQINPHFLFNCLNSIRALVVEDPDRAQEMLTRLANMLRHNLHRDMEHTVPLSAEVEAVEDYLALESVRFEDRLRVSYAIDPAASQAPVPPMLLQTLVENAVKHGVASRPAGGELSIRAARERDTVLVEVENTGHLAESAAGGATQLGLANTRERLRLLYGDRARLELKNRQEGKVAATVVIPVLP